MAPRQVMAVSQQMERTPGGVAPPHPPPHTGDHRIHPPGGGPGPGDRSARARRGPQHRPPGEVQVCGVYICIVQVCDVCVTCVFCICFLFHVHTLPGSGRASASSVSDSSYFVPQSRQVQRVNNVHHGRLVLAAPGGLLVGGLLVLVVVHFTAPQCLSRPPDSCPNKWTRSGDKCFFISRETNVWDSSLEFCRSGGGTLLPGGQEKQEEIRALHHLVGDYWVGLRKDTDTGEWRQLDGSVWTRPIKFDDPQRSCALIDSGHYVALDCSTPRRWICVRSLQRGDQ
ncbi:killer cell lectin-like receptor subfamily G member 1 [Dendropsophus ebraccatus]|uniref:killer cell lectin-like receptor subfamily G member 1 n=1 Tax=Dendropsophus ebraccatus TaxID=150705 RepID=UPI00383231CF